MRSGWEEAARARGEVSVRRQWLMAGGGSIGRGKRGWSGGVWEQMVWVMERRWDTVGDTVGHVGSGDVEAGYDETEDVERRHEEE